MSRFTNSQGELVARIEKIRTELDTSISTYGSKQFRDLWPSWNARLLQIADLSRTRPRVPIAMVGPTGAGKSTLVNALIGHCLLPVSNEKVCTSSVTEVAYAEGQNYEAVVEFISMDDWQRELEALQGDLADSMAPEVSSSREGDDIDSVRLAARDKILAVYRPKEPSDVNILELSQTPLPASVRRAFSVGKETVTSDDPVRFSEILSDYLDSEGRLWPIVRSVRIRGPFESLECGATLVDLPGLNDPNEARERVTRNYIKDSQYVWVVFEIKRGLNRDLYEFLQTNDLFRQFVMDGRADALTFVATSSDNLALSAAAKKYQLGPRPAKADAVLARNREARQYVLGQLSDLAGGLASRAGEATEEGRELAQTLGNSSIFTVSAREFLRLSDLAFEDDGGLQNVEQTELPALQRHMVSICAGHGFEGHLRSLSDRVDTILAEIKGEWTSQRIRLDGQTETDLPQRVQVEEVLGKNHAFLGPKLLDAHERFIQDLDGSQEVLEQRLKWAISRGEADLEKYLARLSGLFWGTLRAMARRDGCYVGTAGSFDFSVDLAKPILDSIAFAWNNFFGSHLRRCLEEWSGKLLVLSDDHRRQMLAGIEAVVKPSAAMRRDLKAFSEQTRKVLDEQLKQAKAEMDRRIAEVQRDLQGQVIKQIRANMQPAFRKAAKETGQGTKQRMLDILTSSARNVSGQMFQDTERAIHEVVRGLCDGLGRQYQDMALTVDLHCSRAAENLKIGAAQLTMAEVEKQRESLRKLGEAILGLEEGISELTSVGER